MNRQRFVDRQFQVEGSPRSQELAAALAVNADPDFLEAMIHMKSALDEFGGQVFIAATRERVSVLEDGTVVADPAGTFTTLGYIVHYGSKPTIRRLQTEEAAPEVEVAPEPDVEEEFTGDPEPVGVED